MLTAEQVEQFNRDGFVKGPKVLGDDEIQVLRGEVMRVIDQRERSDVRQPVMCHNMGRPDAPVWQIVNIWMASDPFAKLIRNDAICTSMAQLTNARSLRIWHDQIQYKPAGQGGVNMWHQDSPYWGILEPKDCQVTAWVALDDVDEANGCMSMVPGSHHWGNRIDVIHTIKSFDAMPSEWDGHKLEVRTCPVNKGEVHFHHALTWHGSNANTSDRPRRAIALHFMTQDTRYHAAGNHVMKRFVNVNDGEPVTGDAFPLVWERNGKG